MKTLIIENYKTFFDRTLDLPERERSLLESAYTDAKVGHGYLQQYRDSGERYFEHPRAVTLLLMDYFNIMDIYILIPSLFHDLPEEVYFWNIPGKIRYTYGEIVAYRTKMLTKPSLSKFSSKADLLDFYFNQQIYISGWQVCLIKVADRVHNLMTMDAGNWDINRKEKYIYQTECYFPKIIDIIKTHNTINGERAELLLKNTLHNLVI